MFKFVFSILEHVKYIGSSCGYSANLKIAFIKKLFKLLFIMFMGLNIL